MTTNLPEFLRNGQRPRDVVSIVEEMARVEKRAVDSGHASVHFNVAEQDETLETLLKHQTVSVERLPMDLSVSTAPAAHQQGDTIIISIVEERLVVEKRLFVTAEVWIRIDQTPYLVKRVVRLRREHAEIEMDDPATLTQPERTLS